jgi:hypothetical protein
MIDKITAFADANGGGLLGLARGALNLHAQRGLITGNDRDRLLAAFEYLLGLDDRPDVDAVVARVREFHQQIADDPASSLPALTASSIMVDSVSRAAATHSDTFASGAATALADFTTSFVTLASGVLSVLITYNVSAITMMVT